MSGSPKYTNVYYEQARRAELAAAAHRRDVERRQQIEADRRRRLAAQQVALAGRAADLSTRVAGLTRQSSDIAQVAEVKRLAEDITAVLNRARAGGDEEAVRRGRKDLREAERRLDRLATAVAKELMLRERNQAVDMMLGQLKAVPDHELLDQPGYRHVVQTAAVTRGKVDAAKGFAEDFERLRVAVLEHLQRVRDVQLMLARVVETAGAAESRLLALAQEASAAGVLDAEVKQVEHRLATVHADLAQRRASEALNGVTILEQEVESLSAAVEAELARLDRLNIVLRAATAALPRAGLRVVGGTIALGVDNGVSFRAERADGTPIQVTVHAGADVTTLEYRTEGSDFVVERLPGGELRECDVTEQLLNRVGEELAKEDLRTDDVTWEGKSTVPRSSVAMNLPTEQGRQAGAR